MKKFTAILLILATMSGCLITGCDNRDSSRERDRHRDEEDEDEDDDDEDEDEEEDEDDRSDIVRPGAPSSGNAAPLYETQTIDETMQFDTVYADPVDTPWVLENNIPFTTSNYIYSYFSEFLVNSSSGEEVPTEILNNQATIVRPSVRHYPADEPGYTVYEITYTESFPTSAVVPDNWGGSMRWWYHDVQFVDYYTGTIFPYINFDSDTDSFCVYGDVVYNGQTYTVYYYSFRDSEVVTNQTVTDQSGREIFEYSVEMHMTNYFIVPNDYDGIVMCVFTTDDTDTPFEELCEQSYPYFVEPHVFNNPAYEDYLEDYQFWSIAELG